MLLYNNLPNYQYDLNLLWDRFWDKVEPTGFCWNWTAYKDRNGYGLIALKNKPGTRAAVTGLAHRISYLLLVGEFDRGLHLDHLCRNPSCVNPDHLEPVELTENTARGYSIQRIAYRKQECTKGHALTPENTYTVPKSGRRRCKTCIKAYGKESWKKHKREISSN